MKEAFLNKATLSDSFISSVQRARIYVPNLNDTQKRPFKNGFKERLACLEAMYREPVDCDSHISCIREFSNELSRDYGGVLVGSRLRIGIAQKGVNLCLKYLWCLDRIPEPPHCPVDAIVLRAIHSRQKWTQVDSTDDYREIIAECQRVAQNRSLSQWELELWNREAP